MEDKSKYKKRSTRKTVTAGPVKKTDVGDPPKKPVATRPTRKPPGKPPKADPNEKELIALFKKVLEGLQGQVGDASDSLSDEAKAAIAQYDAIRADLSVTTGQESPVPENRQWTLPEPDPNVVS